MITFEQFLQNKRLGAFGSVQRNNPTLMMHNRERKAVESPASVTQRTGRSSIERINHKKSALPSGPSIGVAPGKQRTIDPFKPKRLQFFQNGPKVKNVKPPESLL